MFDVSCVLQKLIDVLCFHSLSAKLAGWLHCTFKHHPRSPVWVGLALHAVSFSESGQNSTWRHAHLALCSLDVTSLNGAQETQKQKNPNNGDKKKPFPPLILGVYNCTRSQGAYKTGKNPISIKGMPCARELSKEQIAQLYHLLQCFRHQIQASSSETQKSALVGRIPILRWSSSCWISARIFVILKFLLPAQACRTQSIYTLEQGSPVKHLGRYNHSRCSSQKRNLLPSPCSTAKYNWSAW